MSQSRMRGRDFQSRFAAGKQHPPAHCEHELAEEIVDARLHHIETLGIDSPASLIPDLKDRTNPLHLERLIVLAKTLETESMVIGTAAHIMAIARK